MRCPVGALGWEGAGAGEPSCGKAVTGRSAWDLVWGFLSQS